MITTIPTTVGKQEFNIVTKNDSSAHDVVHVLTLSCVVCGVWCVVCGVWGVVVALAWQSA